jgi:hypothetical protein
MARKVDLKAKAKRQKIIAAVGAVILLGVLAIQVPRTMKMLNAQAPPPPTASATPTTGDPSVLPTPGSVGGTPTTPAAGGGSGGTLIDSDVAPSPETGQLVSFGRFQSKDPFKQQIDLDAAAEGGGGGGEEPAEPGAPAKPGGMTPGKPGAPAAAAGTAVISVNGVEETVAVKAEFPKDAPVFRLASIAGGKARIGIAGGAFASGSPTLTLEQGTPITLVNTADGVRYELELISVG